MLGGSEWIGARLIERARFQATVSFGIILFNQYCLLPRARGLEDWSGWNIYFIAFILHTRYNFSAICNFSQFFFWEVCVLSSLLIIKLIKAK